MFISCPPMLRRLSALPCCLAAPNVSNAVQHKLRKSNTACLNALPEIPVYQVFEKRSTSRESVVVLVVEL